MKKTLALLFALVMVLSMLPAMALALPGAGLSEIDPPKKVEPTEAAPWGGFTRPTVDYDYALEFTAEDTYVDDSNPYKDWLADFKISISHPVQADQIRLAGCYGSFGWIEIKPEELLGNVQIDANTEYPVIGSFLGQGIPYEMVVNDVKTFQCAFYVDPAVREQYPDFTVSLSLVMTEPNGTEHTVGGINRWPAPEIPAAPIPETGDGMGIFVFAGLALVSVLGMAVLRRKEQF